MSTNPVNKETAEQKLTYYGRPIGWEILTARLGDLTYLMHNLHRAVPVTRLVRRTESHIAARTKVHWAVFRKVLSDDLGELLESQHWDTVTEYIMAVWEVVTMTPVWEESVHNNTRNTCFRLLAQAVMKVRVERVHKIWKHCSA